MRRAARAVPLGGVWVQMKNGSAGSGFPAVPNRFLCGFLVPVCRRHGGFGHCRPSEKGRLKKFQTACVFNTLRGVWFSDGLLRRCADNLLPQFCDGGVMRLHFCVGNGFGGIAQLGVVLLLAVETVGGL